MACLLCFSRWDVPDGAAKAAVVLPIDPIEGFRAYLTYRFPRPYLVDSLRFEKVDDAFGDGIIIGIAGGSDR